MSKLKADQELQRMTLSILPLPLKLVSSTGEGGQRAFPSQAVCPLRDLCLRKVEKSAQQQILPLPRKNSWKKASQVVYIPRISIV